MKTIVATLNAKYIHGSLAVRLLYVANKHRFDISFREYTLKEAVDTIAEDLLSTGCDCIGLGVYIWNVANIKKLVIRLKAIKPNIIVVLGGPEVSYEPEFFLEDMDVDFVVSGEGEFVFGELLHALENGLPTTINGVSSSGCISNVVASADLKQLAALPSPYQLEEDREGIHHRLVYFETSRGCPYQCAYCLSSLERGVRYFPKDYILSNLQYLITHGVRQIKFLDRTFNLNKQHTQQVFDFLVTHYRPELSCQFEIYADLMDSKTIDWLNECLPAQFFRFEIGIQSTYGPSNLAVNRKQDFPILSDNIHKLMEGNKIDLHLDLIAGLPYETLDRFVQSFNDVFAFGAKEVQLGFLKMLRGTALRKNAATYGYVYAKEAPYQVVSNNWISAGELQQIHDVEHALEKYWNSGRFSHTMNALTKGHYKGRYFELFDEIALYCKQQQYLLYGYQLEDLYRYLDDFLKSKEIDLCSLLREDYYNNFTIRPTGSFWTDPITKKERKLLLYRISQDKAFLETHQLTAYTIQKQTVINLMDGNRYLLTVFMPEERKQLEYYT